MENNCKVSENGNSACAIDNSSTDESNNRKSLLNEAKINSELITLIESIIEFLRRLEYQHVLSQYFSGHKIDDLIKKLEKVNDNKRGNKYPIGDDNNLIELLNRVKSITAQLTADDISPTIKQYAGDDVAELLKKITTFLQDIGADSKKSEKKEDKDLSSYFINY